MLTQNRTLKQWLGMSWTDPGDPDDPKGCRDAAARVAVFLVVLIAAVVLPLLGVTNSAQKVLVTDENNQWQLVKPDGKSQPVDKKEAVKILNASGHWENGQWVVDVTDHN